MASLLIVDENVGHSSSLVTLLGNGGHELRHATDGAQALNLVGTERPDLVITDILMARMDGYEFVQRLRSTEDGADTPVIFCTGATREEEARALAKECGVDHVLVKPFDLQRLSEAIDSCLTKNKPENSNQAVEDLDREYLRLLMDEADGQTERSNAVNLRMEAFLKVSLQLASLMEPESLVRESCKWARQLLGAKYAVAGLESAEGEAAERLFLTGVEWECSDDAGVRHTVHRAVRGLLQGRRSVRLRNPEGNPLMLRFPSDYPSFYSILSVPIVSPHRTYGWLCLFHKLGALEFSPEDQRVAEILGGLSGRIYESGRTHLLAQDHARRLEQELSERKRAEEQLRTAKELSEAWGRSAREATERLSLALRASRTGVWSWDVTNDLVTWDDHIHRMFGLTPERFGGNFSDLVAVVHAEDRPQFTKAFIGLTRDDKTALAEFRVIWPDGSVHHIESSGQAFYDDANRMIRRTGVARDITEQRRLEDQLRQAQKMDAIGQLAGGIAHDFNNVLTVISGFSGLLLANIKPDDPHYARLQQIRKAGERGAALTRQLLAFSRKQMLQPKVLNLGDLIRDMDQMISRVIGEHIEVVTLIGPNLSQLKIDQGQLEQVLLNLVINGRDAMPEGGKLTIEARDEDVTGPEPGSDVPPGNYVLLSVRDTGTGISPELQDRIFEPFFTTKEIGRGTGLGLATVYGIVKQSGGHISFRSDLNSGTTFTILLPRIEERPEALESRGDQEFTHGNETILVVEDDPGLRCAIQEILGTAGYTVLTAENGGEAIRISERHEGHIDLLLSDVIMPKIGGVEVASQVSKLRPNTKILLMSGYTGGPCPRTDSGAAIELIPKPWTPEDLSVKIREVLDRRSPIRRILVAEDEDGVRNWMKEVLQGAGYEVIAVRQGKEARVVVKEHRFDLLITDLAMPEEDGLELIRTIRENHPRMEVIAASGAFGYEMLKVAKIFGCHAILTKPLVAEELLETIRSLPYVA
jgi:PAS domain S-box-containing protein